MYPTTILQVLHRDTWEEIGWRAGTPESVRDLREHGASLAAICTDKVYRLAYLSPLLHGEPEPYHYFTVREAAR